MLSFGLLLSACVCVLVLTPAVVHQGSGDPQGADALHWPWGWCRDQNLQCGAG